MSWKSIIILERQAWLLLLYAASIDATISPSNPSHPVVILKSQVSE
jgi:hypothetical protein